MSSIPQILIALAKPLCINTILLIQLNKIKQFLMQNQIVKIKMNRVTNKIFSWKLCKLKI